MNTDEEKPIDTKLRQFSEGYAEVQKQQAKLRENCDIFGAVLHLQAVADGHIGTYSIKQAVREQYEENYKKQSKRIPAEELVYLPRRDSHEYFQLLSNAGLLTPSGDHVKEYTLTAQASELLENWPNQEPPLLTAAISNAMKEFDSLKPAHSKPSQDGPDRSDR